MKKYWWVWCMGFALTNLYAERITYVETPVVSMGLDRKNEKPVESTGETLTYGVDTLYASAWVHNAIADSKVNIWWYHYDRTGRHLLKKEEKKVIGYTFAWSKFTLDGYPLPLGGYEVVFQVDISVKKRAFFQIIPRLVPQEKVKKSTEPTGNAPTSQACQETTPDQDYALLKKVSDRYPEVKPLLQSMEFTWLKEPTERIRFFAPKGWIHREKEDRAFLSMHRPGHIGREKIFMEILASHYMEGVKPEKAIAKLLDLSAKNLAKRAEASRASSRRVGTPNIFHRDHYLIGHQVLRHTGKPYTHWMSITFVWDGKTLYGFDTVMEPNDLALGEFLSAHFVESF
jgi:hypothetical protein